MDVQARGEFTISDDNLHPGERPQSLTEGNKGNEESSGINRNEWING